MIIGSGARGRRGRSGNLSGLGLAKHEIAFHNTSGSASNGLVRFGVAFEDGDVPSGQTARVRIKNGANVRSHAVETTSYASGALRKATMVADIGSVSGSGSTTVEVYNVSGSVAASSFNAPSWVSGSADDLVCEIRNRTGSSDSHVANLGNLDTSLKTAFGTSSRIFTIANCDLFYRVWVWEKLSGEEHLTPIIHASWWLDTDGSTVKALELVPVLSQHWWVDDPFSTQQTKELQRYDATWKWGTTTLDTRSTLNHPYNNQWASLRSDDDAQHARPHWINISSTAMPTLRAVYTSASLEKMMRARILPPQKYTLTPGADTFETTYVPLSRNGMSFGIGAAGTHVERGLMPRQMSDLLCLQTESAWRKARVGSQAAMTVYSHVRDHRTATTLSDASMGIIPAPFTQLGAKSYDDLGSEAIHVLGSGGTLIHDAAVGGTGDMVSFDEEHAGNYGGLISFLDGERYLFEACLDAWHQCTIQDNWNIFGHNAKLFFAENTARATALNIPATEYGMIAGYRSQERTWTDNLWAWAYALCPDADRHKDYLYNFIANKAEPLDVAINGDGGDYDGYPAGHKAFGYLWGVSDNYCSPWMAMIRAMSMYHASGQIETQSIIDAFADGAEQAVRPVMRAINQKWYMHLGSYRIMWTPEEGDYLNTMPLTGFWALQDVYVDPDNDRLEFVDAQDASTIFAGYSLTSGDILYFGERTVSGGAITLETSISLSTPYYVQNVSGSTCQISTDVGGTNIVDLTATTTQCVAIHFSDYDDKYATIGAAGSYGGSSGGDGTLQLIVAGIEMCWAYNNVNLSEADYLDVSAWLATLPQANFTPFALDGTIIRSAS